MATGASILYSFGLVISDVLSAAYWTLGRPYCPVENTFLVKGVYTFCIGRPADHITLVVVHQADVTARRMIIFSLEKS